MNCTPWKKMKKEERIDWANRKMFKGFAIFLFGLLWMYFGSLTTTGLTGDIEGLTQTLTVLGLLLFLFGLVKRFSA